MKPLCLLVFLLLSILGQAQESQFVFTEVVSVDSSINKDALFLRAKQWVATRYNSANNVIQMQDQDAGIIIVNGIIPVKVVTIGIPSPAGYVKYTLKIYLKDGRYKYEMTDFWHEAGTSEMKNGGALSDANADDKWTWTNGRWIQLKEDVTLFSTGLIRDLKTEMSKPITGVSDDW